MLVVPTSLQIKMKSKVDDMDKKSSGTISNVPNSNRSCFRNIYRSMLDTLDQGIATNTDVTNLYDDFNFTNDKFTDEEPE